MRTRRAVLVTLAGLALTAGCAADSEGESDEVPDDPIAQMEIAFNGHPRQAVIQEAMDEAFDATDTAKTSENYSRAGSTLVTLRESNGTDEMDVLNCIPSQINDPRVPEITFPNVAAVCSAMLVGG